jgi:hypothetical protein
MGTTRSGGIPRAGAVLSFLLLGLWGMAETPAEPAAAQSVLQFSGVRGGLDGHAHLGNLDFDRRPETAIRHYDIGCQIGELSLGPDFKGVLLWAMIDNRTYLRCLHGYGLCLWRLKRFDEAAAPSSPACFG